jgi:hypothetical protein
MQERAAQFFRIKYSLKKTTIIITFSLDLC